MAEIGLALRNHNVNKLVRQNGKSNLHGNNQPAAKSTSQVNYMRPTKSSIAAKTFTVFEDPDTSCENEAIDENNVIHLLERKCREEQKNCNQGKRSPLKSNRRPLHEVKLMNRELSMSDDDDLYSARSHATDASVRNDLLQLGIGDIKTSSSCEDSIDEFLSASDEDARSHANFLYGAPQFDDNIYEYMCLRETRTRPRHDFLKKQKDVTKEMRHILIDWLSDVVNEYNMCQETLHLSVSLVDRALSRFHVQRDKLQLIGATSKFEEIYPPETKDFVYMTDDSYEIKHLLLMERAILMELNFDISVPTIVWFANRIINFLSIDETTKFATEYILDLTLLEPSFLEFKPSYIAAGCISYANILCGEIAWNKQLEDCTGIRFEHLKKIILKLHEAFKKAPDAANNSIYTHYAEIHKREVANISPPTLPFEV